MEHNIEQIVDTLYFWKQIKNGNFDSLALFDIEHLDTLSRMVLTDNYDFFEQIKPRNQMELIRYVSSKYYDGIKKDFFHDIEVDINAFDLFYTCRRAPECKEQLLPWLCLTFQSAENIPNESFILEALDSNAELQRLMVFKNFTYYQKIYKKLENPDLLSTLSLAMIRREFDNINDKFSEIIQILQQYHIKYYESQKDYGVLKNLESEQKKELYFNAPLLVVGNNLFTLSNTERLGFVDRIINADYWNQINDQNKSKILIDLFCIDIRNGLNSYFVESLHESNQYKKLWNIAKSIDLNGGGFIRLLLDTIEGRQIEMISSSDLILE